MGLRLIYDDHQDIVAMYCSTSGVAFGHVFQGHDCLEEAEHFLEWCNKKGYGDARKWSNAQLEYRHAEWFKETHDKNGEFK